MKFSLKITNKGHIGIFAPTDMGWLPVLVFEDWEGYSDFLKGIQSFYTKHHPEVPEAFRGVFEDHD